MPSLVGSEMCIRDSEMTSHQEKKVYFNLITTFARYVLLLKEFQEKGQIATNPKTNIQNFIDDQVFDLKRKGTGIISAHTFNIPKSNGNIAHLETKTINLTGVKVTTPPMVEHPIQTKAILDDKTKHLDNMAQTVIEKYDNPTLSKKMENEGKLTKVPKRKINFNKYSFRYGNIDEKLKHIKKMNGKSFHHMKKHLRKEGNHHTSLNKNNSHSSEKSHGKYYLIFFKFILKISTYFRVRRDSIQ